MCTNFRPPARLIVAEMFDIPAPDFAYPEETYPGYPAPMIRRSLTGRYQCVRGQFGLIPSWSRDATIGRRTYNARTETVAEKPSFRGAWRRSQRALVPMDRFYEPDWHDGRAVRWRIERRNGEPFTVAALWERWVDRSHGDEVVESFTLLTINADGHPVMGRFHRPGDEKRSLVPIARDDWSAWLDDDPEAAARLLLPMPPSEFISGPDPRPPTTRRRAEAGDGENRGAEGSPGAGPGVGVAVDAAAPAAASAARAAAAARAGIGGVTRAAARAAADDVQGALDLGDDDNRGTAPARRSAGAAPRRGRAPRSGS